MRTRTKINKRPISKCQHLKGWKWKTNPDGSVTRKCKKCRLRILMLAIGRGIVIKPMKGNYLRKNKRDD